MRVPFAASAKQSDVSWTHGLDETLSDADFKANPERWNQMPGGVRYENNVLGGGAYRNVYAHGECIFAWVCNRSGSAQARGELTKWYAVAAASATGGSTTTIEDTAAFTADHEVWNIVHINDDAGAAGAAPEGEFGFITENTVDILTVQTPAADGAFTAAVVATDTYDIASSCMVVDAASGDSRSELAGVVMAASLANDYWGWICLRTGSQGFVGAVITTAAVTAADSLIAGANCVVVSSTSDHFLSCGSAVFAAAADQAVFFMPIRLDCYTLLQESA